MADALCAETAQPRAYVSAPHHWSGAHRMPGRVLVTAVRYEKPERKFLNTRKWIEKAKLTLYLFADGSIHTRTNFIFTKAYHHRETRNPLHFLKRLPSTFVLSYDLVAQLAREWSDQGYIVTCAPSKRIKAALVLAALETYGQGFK